MNFFTVPPRPDIEAQWLLTKTRYAEWLHGELFSWQWWVLLAGFATSAFVIWRLADRSRLAETVTYTSLIVIFILVLDELGEEAMLWYYPVDLLFMFPPASAVDITCMPSVYMILFQRFRKWRSFLIAMVVMAAIFCFILEPIFVWCGVYVMLQWKSWYGFPIYVFIAVASKFITQMINRPRFAR
jgi:hypothetical protein